MPSCNYLSFGVYVVVTFKIYLLNKFQVYNTVLWIALTMRDIIHNSQDMEISQLPIGGWMDKEIVVYIYNGRSFRIINNISFGIYFV